MVFGFLKGKLKVAVNQFSGNKDFIEAVCAASALVANADNNISDDEMIATVTILENHPELSKAFTKDEIDRTAETMFNRVKTGLSGRIGLYKEIADIAANPDMAETVYVTAYDVANADNNISPEELKVLHTIAGKLRIDPRKYEI